MNISDFNYIESILWFSCAVTLCVVGIKTGGKTGRYFKMICVAVPAFVAFGISDIIEAHTGAWWKPLPLLCLKVLCVVIIAGCYYQYHDINNENT